MFCCRLACCVFPFQPPAGPSSPTSDATSPIHFSTQSGGGRSISQPKSDAELRKYLAVSSSKSRTYRNLSAAVEVCLAYPRDVFGAEFYTRVAEHLLKPSWEASAPLKPLSSNSNQSGGTVGRPD